MEHGFAGKEFGTVVVNLTRRDGTTELCVIDDGAGLPPEFALAHSDSLGLKLVASLTRQIGAQLSIENRPSAGTILRLVLPDNSGRDGSADVGG
ncbi:hypothetical protein P0F65_06805 [Sphingomonas sp. I4]